MFQAARWQLTLWFLAALALILALTGAAVYLTTRAVLFDQVDDDLRSRASREVGPLAARLLGHSLREGPDRDIAVGPAFTAGGYFYALVDRQGALLAGTANVDPAGLAGGDAVATALSQGPTFSDTASSDGDHLRVFVVPLAQPRQPRLALQVGRSTEPERDALRTLVLIMAAGGGAGLVLALGGGYVLAGRALRPIGAAMDRQRAFVADASHELRTPLSLIRASAELLKRHGDQPVEANIASVEDIIQESDRLGGLVGQMLTLAGADASQAPFAMAPVDLSELARDVGRQVRLLADEKGVGLAAEVDGDVRLEGDPLRLRELFLILLDNAVKFTDRGGSVRLELQPQPGRVQVRVADTGRGIPPEALARVFDRFYRADRARSREEGGAGLGLAIAKWIVEGHGGTIQAESEVGRGTTVTVSLPLP